MGSDGKSLGLGALAAVSPVGGIVAGTALSMVGARRKSQEEAATAEFEAEQLKIQEQSNRIAASQAEAKRRNELVSSIETIQAIQAGRGVGLTSPTSVGIIGDVSASAERDIRAERLGYLTKAEQSRRLSEMATRKARYSLLAGDLEVAGAAVSGGTKIAQLGMKAAGGGRG